MVEAPLSRTEWAVGRLQEAILSGELAPGERVSSSELARRWSVSATPLREALQRLAAEGLVEYVSQRGARVSEVSLRDVREVYELRLMLEPMALERSLRRVDDGWRREVEKAYAALRDELEGGFGDLMAFEKVNRDFHGALLSRCDSGWLLRVVRMLSDHCVRYRALSRWTRGGAKEVLREHEEIHAACVAGEVERAGELLHEHLRRTRDAILEGDGPTPGRGETADAMGEALG
jgi:GntR family transcriptional regulator, carbon starvation induced regulator